MVYSKQPYIFDKKKIELPARLQMVLTPECNQVLNKVVETASIAFRHLKAMEKYRNDRYRAMCPRDSLSRYILHSESVDRLFSWGQDHNPNDPTLAPHPKISPSVLYFHVEQHAYDKYAEEYTKALERYLSGSYQQWRNVKQELEHVVSKSGLRLTHRREFLCWWTDVFLSEMAKWEDRLAGLLLPSWEEVIDDVYFAILERVDIGTSAVDQFYIS
ncbi:hypothetical protein PHISCL_02511 [Aspergillus sclerotialis]|uniref:Uncharacterized protein n=1 Tax=Aspergillus sclerotialis TaxID=2070753 RepID=A0A3A2ZPS4_9EURO|nr:hypothetical protein PHISCL_02511 [Aspergillus sclerotialis]